MNALPEPPLDRLKARAMRAATATSVSQAVKVLVQMASVVVLARLLSPADFGVIAMAAPIVSFIAIFQDLGLGQAVIQRSDITHAQVSGLFWVNVAVCASLGLLLAALSPLVGLYYHEPKAVAVTAAFGGLVALNGLGTQSLALLNRNLRFGTIAALDASSAIFGLISATAFALLFKSYWALFAGTLTTTLINAFGPLLLAGWIPGPPRRGAGIRSLLRFGAGVTGFNLVNFFARNADNLLIGRYRGPQELGLYDRAYKLLLMPMQLIVSPLARIMTPILSRLAADPPRYRRAYMKAMQQLLLLVMPGVAFMTASATLLVPTLLGQRWAAAGPIFAALGFAASVQPLNGTAGWLLISQARLRDYFIAGVVGAAIALTAFSLGLSGGAAGVARFYAVSELLKTPLLWWFVTRRGPVERGPFAAAVLAHVLSFLAAFAAVEALLRLVDLPPLATLALGAACAYAAGFAVLLVLPAGRAALADALDLGQTALGKLRGQVGRRASLQSD